MQAESPILSTRPDPGGCRVCTSQEPTVWRGAGRLQDVGAQMWSLGKQALLGQPLSPTPGLAPQAGPLPEPPPLSGCARVSRTLAASVLPSALCWKCPRTKAGQSPLDSLHPLLFFLPYSTHIPNVVTLRR